MSGARSASSSPPRCCWRSATSSLVIALRSGAEFSVIGAFRYASILWAIAIGYVVWGDVPNALALVGIAVIVGAGLYILHRERVRT